MLTDGVSQQQRLPTRQRQSSRGRVQRRKQLVLLQHPVHAPLGREREEWALQAGIGRSPPVTSGPGPPPFSLSPSASEPPTPHTPTHTHTHTAPSLRQHVEQRGLAGVGVAHQRDNGERRQRPSRAVRAAVLPHVVQVAAQRGQPGLEQTAVHLQLGLAGPAPCTSRAGLALQVRPQPRQAWQLV